VAMSLLTVPPSSRRNTEGSPVSNEPQHHEQEHFVTEPTGAPPGVQLGAVERNREKIAAHNKKMAASTIGAGKQGGAAGR
jgi:hypothetical protein